jgi:hypothetical protein
MDAHAAQLRRQIDATRAAMDAQLTQLEQHVSQMPAAILEQTVGGPVRGVQETLTRATTLLHQYPWLIIAGGALVSYQLRRARARPVRPVQSLPQRAAVAPRSDRPSTARARPAVYDNPQPPPARAADPPAPGEPTKAAPSDPRPFAWTFGG